MNKTTRIEICGGIASGKTTLCRAFEKSSFDCVIERFDQNPFWALFYQNAQKYCFETEITFLLQHYSQIKSANLPAICDFSLIQDMSYAQVNLTGGQIDAFRCVYRQVISELPAPLLIVHLECSPQIELERIVARKRPEETTVQLSYLEELNGAVRDAVDRARGSLRILEYDSGCLDFAYDPRVQSFLLDEIISAASVV